MPPNSPRVQCTNPEAVEVCAILDNFAGTFAQDIAIVCKSGNTCHTRCVDGGASCSPWSSTCLTKEQYNMTYRGIAVTTWPGASSVSPPNGFLVDRSVEAMEEIPSCTHSDENQKLLVGDFCATDSVLLNFESGMGAHNANCSSASPRGTSSAKSLSQGDDPFSMVQLEPWIEDPIWGKQGDGSVSPDNFNGENSKSSTFAIPLVSLFADPVDLPGMDTKVPAASASWMAVAKEEAVEGERKIPVVDPQRSKLHVPFSAIFPTKALGGRVSFPSLCLLFQAGRCLRGSNCYQMHIDPDVVRRLRQINESLPFCCTFHGDCNSKMWDAQGRANHTITIKGVTVPLSHVAYTNGLERFVLKSNHSGSLNTCAICRLHCRPGGCRYGADCWYVHICREVLRDLIATLHLNLEGSNGSSEQRNVLTNSNFCAPIASAPGNTFQQDKKAGRRLPARLQIPSYRL
ncbi:hypothetical protein TRVL_04992 [Trypanosoma vivax]|uniref:C3H1-type domain-containing protein n=1 Tax=Trypanosoma vivax (strain Y486) TaxID=1055687 RepID=G0TY78_TRYVY|nr:hypothetical protein TRVL_04992 [Trypanosoma vivax]CCC48923.1 conserved hypothetical protein [Trypanosoma vivax Y486]